MVLAPACSPVDDVWGIEIDELRERLARSDYEVLRNIPFSRYELADASRLGPEAFYALGLVYLSIGLDGTGEELLTLAVERSPEPWRESAARELSELLFETERPDQVIELFSTTSAEDLALTNVLRLARALYETRDLPTLAGLLDARAAELDAFTDAEAEAQEVALWRTVTAIETDSPGWEQTVMDLFMDFPASAIHSRLWVYLINNDDLLATFAPSAIDFMRFKQLQSEGKSEEAFAIAAGLDDLAVLSNRWGIRDLYLAAAGSVRYTLGARLLEDIAVEVPDELLRLVLEYIGRLYRLAGAYPSAIAALDRAVPLAVDPTDARRLRWLSLSARVRQSPETVAGSLELYVPTLDDPAYFSDLFGDLATRLIEARRWDALLQAYSGLSEFAEPGVLARYQLVLARLFETGLLPAVPGRAEELRTDFLRRASEQTGDRFAALMAAALLGEDGTEQLAIIPDDPEDSPGVIDPVVRVLLDYGLLDEAFLAIRGSGSRASDVVRTAAATLFADRGRTREAVLLLPRSDRDTRSRAELRYPQSFAAAIDPASEAEDLDRAILFGLFREESLFDAAIESSAGAVGIAQLMPATAEDIARRMRLGAFDLRNPEDSILIGARYLAMLRAQFGTYARAIAAYNGGQGNVRSWERRNGDLDEVLFHQTIPFPETYSHVIKVTVAAAHYSFLYDDRAPADVVRTLFGLSPVEDR